MAAGQEYGLRRLGRWLGIRSAFMTVAHTLGYDVVKKHYYSEVPDLACLPPEIWSATSELSGLRFDIEAGLRFVEHELGPFVSEFQPPRRSTGEAAEFYLENTFYEGLDAETLYAMVRRFKPRRVVELGSGMSTLVIAKALARNAEPSVHDVYDPYVRPELRPALERIATVRSVSATELQEDKFTELQSGDVLFVDTTHTVKIGSDVNRIILDVLPKLAPGVFVHFHDIFLPSEYPSHFFTELGFSWAEQYLLQAFLAFNDEYDVLFGTAALKRHFPEAVTKLIPTASESPRPAAFWIRRVGH